MSSSEQGYGECGFLSYIDIPYDSFEIETAMPIEDTVDLLQSNVEPKKVFRMERGYKFFEGKVSQTEFRMSRICGFRNNYISYVYGNIMQSNSGTIIKVQIRPLIFRIVALGIWFCALGIVVFNAAINIFMHYPVPIVFLLIMLMCVLGFVCVVWCLFTVSFWWDAKKSKRKIYEIFS